MSNAKRNQAFYPCAINPAQLYARHLNPQSGLGTWGRHPQVSPPVGNKRCHTPDEDQTGKV